MYHCCHYHYLYYQNNSYQKQLYRNQDLSKISLTLFTVVNVYRFSETDLVTWQTDLLLLLNKIRLLAVFGLLAFFLFCFDENKYLQIIKIRLVY